MGFGGDFFTAFLSQALWIPTETALDGTEYSTTVDYERERGRWVATSVEERRTDGKGKKKEQAQVSAGPDEEAEDEVDGDSI